MKPAGHDQDGKEFPPQIIDVKVTKLVESRINTSNISESQAPEDNSSVEI